MASLSDRALAAVKWNYLGVMARIVSQVAVQVALARLLGPDAFGLFALAFLVVSVCGIIVDLGLGAALIQKAQLSELDVRVAFTRVLLAGVGLAILSYLMSPAIAAWLEDSRVAGVLRGLTPVLILNAITVVPVALLKRDLAFQAIQVVQIVAYLSGFLLVGIGLAMGGAGVWSLVSAWLVQSTIAAVLFYRLRRNSLRPTIGRERTEMAGFGSRVVLTNLVNWVIENVDNLLVGKLFGSTGLGFYSLSYNLVRSPANHLVVTLQAVLFPTTARVHSNLTVIRRAYLTVVAGVAICAFPVFFGVAAVAGTVVAALFGPKWLEASSLLTPLAIAIAFHAPMAIAGPVLWGRGSPGAELRVQVFTGLVLVCALLVAGQYSVTAMAWAVCGVYAVRFIGMTITVCSHIQVGLAQLIASIRGGAFAAALTIVVLVLVDTWGEGLVPLVRLGVGVIGAGIVVGAFVLAYPGFALSRELATLAHRWLGEMPGAAGWLGRLRAAHPAE